MAQQNLPIIQGRDPLGGLRGFFQNLSQGILQQQAGQQTSQQLAQLFPNLNIQGITNPQALQAAVQLGLQQQELAGRVALAQAAPPTIAEQRAAEAARRGARPGTPEFERIAKGSAEQELIITQIGKNRAEAEAKLRAGKGILTPEQKISQTNVFRKEFDVLSKDFRIVRDSFERVKASAADPSPAGDLALIFNFMKILDPGSVVRESEFANAAATGAWGERLKAAGLMILEGVRLSPKMRADFLNRGKRLFEAQQNTQKRLIDRYTGLSGRFGLNPQDIITKIGETVIQPQGQQRPTGLTPAQQKRRAELRAKVRQ